MCGIVGFIDPALAGEGNSSQLGARVKAMAEAIVHRGPDDAGEWTEAASGIALGFRRLSILDLSPTGHQPMESPCGRYVISFNGEIYNHAVLRQELEKRRPDYLAQFKGHSDTAVLLASVAIWGLETSLKRFVGMFAFALWDRAEKTLVLARDRMGEKPLYYGSSHGTLFWASELKPLKLFPQFSPEIDREALTLFLRHNYIPAPYSIYKSVKKLLPATYLKVDLTQIQKGFSLNDLTPISYWSFKETAEVGLAKPFKGTEPEAVDQLDKVLGEAVRLQMEADVPVGAFLSGGIDSSTLVALMAKQNPGKVKTFSIGFGEEGFNEAPYAREVAKHLGTQHEELYVTSEMALGLVPRLPEIFDEPFADSSQIPTYFVSELARRHVTVSLSGDGADELFGGYSRYPNTLALWGKLGKLPQPWRGWIGKGIQKFPAEMVGQKLIKAGELLSADSFEETYRGMVSHWLNPEQVVLAGKEPQYLFTDRSQWVNDEDPFLRMLFLDSVTYLPDDILVKVDRASMAVSLESRAPFLDHRVAGLAWRLPTEMKYKDGQGKRVLRQLLARYVPEKLFERPKMGFGVPIDQWLRGPLRDWAEALLNEQRLKDEGFFNPAIIRQKWREHLAGTHQWHYPLWNVLTFQAWFEKQ